MVKKQIWTLNVIFILSIFFVSCSNLTNVIDAGGKTEEKQETFETSFVSDFGDDISVPSSLNIVRDQTFINQPQTKKAEGVISLIGKIDIETLIIFFEESMLNAGWVKEYSARPATKSILLFHKGKRKCIINMLSMRNKSYATIWLYITQ